MHPRQLTTAAIILVMVLAWLQLAQGARPPAECVLNVRGSGANGTIAKASMHCTGSQVDAAISQRWLGTFLPNFTGLSWKKTCVNPSCLISICHDSNVVIKDSQIKMINGTNLRSLVCVANTSSVEVRDSTFTYSRARAFHGLHEATVSLVNVTIVQSTVEHTNGACVVVDDSAKLSVDSSRFQACVAFNGSGGGVYASGNSTVTITDSNITSSYCGAYGGGLAAAGNAVVVVAGRSKFESNSASINGGGIAMLGRASLRVSADVLFGANAIQNPILARGYGSFGLDIVALNSSSLDFASEGFAGDTSLVSTSNMTKCSRGVFLGRQPCGAGEYRDVRTDGCVCCPERSYSFEVAASLTCSPCPANSMCPGADVVRPIVGFWRSSNRSAEVHKCPLSEACAEGGVCQPGYQGNLCGACATGYGTVNSMKCAKCMPSEWQLALYVVISCITVLFVAGTVHTTWRDNCSGSVHLRPSDLIKVLLQFAQYLCIIGTVPVPWPHFMRQMFRMSSVAFGAVSGQALSLDCWLLHYAAGSSLPLAIERQLVHFLAPFAIFVAVVVLQLLMGIAERAAARYCCSRSRKQPLPDPLLLVLLHKLPLTALVVGYYAYPTLLKASMSFFACLRIDRGEPGGSATPATVLGNPQGYWVADIQQACFKGYHLAWSLRLGIPALLLTCLGVPAGLLLVLHVYRGRAADPGFREKFGFLYRNYRPTRMYWEAVWALQTILLSLIVTFHLTLEAYHSTLLLALVFVASGILQTICKPYSVQKLHVMHATSTACLLLTSMGALAMFPANNGSPTHTAVAALIVAMIAGFAGWCVYTIVAVSRLCICASSAFGKRRGCW